MYLSSVFVLPCYLVFVWDVCLLPWVAKDLLRPCEIVRIFCLSYFKKFSCFCLFFFSPRGVLFLFSSFHFYTSILRRTFVGVFCLHLLFIKPSYLRPRILCFDWILPLLVGGSVVLPPSSHTRDPSSRPGRDRKTKSKHGSRNTHL